MAYITVTYTFSNLSTADADQVNTNFTDVLNGLSDGSKDLSIAALTTSGATTLNGAVTLGNATGDDLTFTGYVSSHMIVKTDATYDIGDSTHGLRALYLGTAGTGIRNASGSAATPSFSFNEDTNLGIYRKAADSLGFAAGGTEIAYYTSNGIWTGRGFQTSAKEIADAAYTITDTDGYNYVYSSTTLTAARTITLPTVADNYNRIITFKKMDTNQVDTGIITIDGEGAETIDGRAALYLYAPGDTLTIIGAVGGWHVLNYMATYIRSNASAGDITWVNCTSDPATWVIKIVRYFDHADLYVKFTTVNITSTTLRFTMPRTELRSIEDCWVSVLGEGTGSGSPFATRISTDGYTSIYKDASKNTWTSGDDLYTLANETVFVGRYRVA